MKKILLLLLTVVAIGCEKDSIQEIEPIEKEAIEYGSIKFTSSGDLKMSITGDASASKSEFVPEYRMRIRVRIQADFVIDQIVEGTGAEVVEQDWRFCLS